MSAIVIRDDGAGLRFHLICDRTMATYLWDVLRDALVEFGGMVLSAR
jgi:hypothetical protein